MQHAGAIAGAGHPRVRQAHHVAMAFLQQFLRHRQHAPFRHPRPTLRPGITQHQHVVGGNIPTLVIHCFLQRRVIVEHHRRSGMLQKALIHRRRFDHAAIGREVAGEHGERALAVNRVARAADHVVIEDPGAFDVLTQGFSRNREAIEVQMRANFAHQSADATGVEKILHQIGDTGRADIADDGHKAARAFKIGQADILPGTACHRDQMDDGVSRTAHRHGHCDGVLERRPGLDFTRGEVLPHHLDDAPAGFRRQPDMPGIRRQHRTAARQHHADRLGNRGHCARSAHRHAGAVAAGDAGLNAEPVFVRDFAGTQFVPVFPGIAAATEEITLEIAAQHGSCRQKDGWQIHAGGAQQQPRRGLVAAAHQHHRINRVRSQQLLGLHRQHVAIHHRGWLDEAFAHRQRRQFDREATCHQDAALDVLDSGFEMGMAWLQIGPGVEDGDHRLASPLLGRVAHLHRPRPMAEGAQIGRSEPPRGAQIGRCFTRGGCFRHDWFLRR